MSRKTFIIAGLVFACIMTKAQNSVLKQSPNADTYTSIKPADGHPYVFGSQQDLDARFGNKKNNLIAAIKQNQGDSLKVRKLRENLWRLENAIIKNAGNK